MSEKVDNAVKLLDEFRLVAILRAIPHANLPDVLLALEAGGIRMVEITFDQSSPSCLEETCTAILLATKRFAGRLCIGAGTVLTTEQALCAAEAGAEFALSPHTDADVIATIKKQGMACIPGATTPSEMMLAHNMGADIIKAFPAATMGERYYKDILAPLSHLKLMAVGGIDMENIQNFTQIGFHSFGIGSKLVNATHVAAGEYESITEDAKQYVDVIQTCYGGKNNEI
ncbi:2-dehydro-3-deoxyphosphogluconate aldolase [Eubacteriales bacterium OttesenSCG-928-N14]|nr:2-dehydro-3-deoxyphosphogluconate aldolase [Eubacteriales bacterium OttesenSCG-928-N14]